MHHPSATAALDAEITALKAIPSLPDLAVRLNGIADAQRERLLAALDGDPLQHRVELTLRVQKLLPRSTPEQVGRDVCFLLAAPPSPDLKTHEQILLQFLGNPGDLAWKKVYADFLDDRGDPRGAALRAEIAAVEAGMPPQAVCGVLDAQRHFGIAYTPDQLEGLAAMPYSKQTLEAYKDTHVLVAGAPLSLNDIRRRMNDYFYGDHWYHDRPFARDKVVDTRWYLLRKNPLPRSLFRNLSQQTALLKENEVVPFACEVAYVVILHWLTHCERLQWNLSVRCQDKLFDGCRSSFGHYGGNPGHFGVNICANQDCSGSCGLASSVSPQES